MFVSKAFKAARTEFLNCLTELEEPSWCPLARDDLSAILHANLAETCLRLGEDPTVAVEHAIKLSPFWERGCVTVALRVCARSGADEALAAQFRAACPCGAESIAAERCPANCQHRP